MRRKLYSVITFAVSFPLSNQLSLRMFVRVTVILLYQAVISWSSVTSGADDRGIGAASVHALLHLDPFTRIIQHQPVPFGGVSESVSGPVQMMIGFQELLDSASIGLSEREYQDQFETFHSLCQRVLENNVTIENLVMVFDVAVNATTSDGTSLLRSLFSPSSDLWTLSYAPPPASDIDHHGPILILDAAGAPIPLMIRSADGHRHYQLVSGINMDSEGRFFSQFIHHGMWYTTHSGSIASSGFPDHRFWARGIYIERSPLEDSGIQIDDEAARDTGIGAGADAGRQHAGATLEDETTTTTELPTTTEVFYTTNWPTERHTIFAADNERPTTNPRL